ncbi:MAG: hypothetical protein IIW41_04890, partial [Selenomonadaceae bacterium]|nr:hypothetical protein [Selenomonadaceae bacterium]
EGSGVRDTIKTTKEAVDKQRAKTEHEQTVEDLLHDLAELIKAKNTPGYTAQLKGHEGKWKG